jgi:hypothetical protein
MLSNIFSISKFKKKKLFKCEFYETEEIANEQQLQLRLISAKHKSLLPGHNHHHTGELFNPLSVSLADGNNWLESLL